MKKLTFLITFLFAITAFSFADTHIPAGDVSGNWAFANSPYIIDGEISIQLGDELTIEPGVQVLFSGHYKFNIYGRILAQGTLTDTIVFTAQDTLTGWLSLRFWDTNTNGQDSSEIVYCNLEFGKATGDGYDTYGGAIFCNNSSPILSYITITGNSASSSGGGICCWNNSNPILENATITGNSASSRGGGIYCRNNSNPILAYVTITGNSVSSRGGGIYCQDNSNPILAYVTITGNSASSSGGGIYCQNNSNPILENVTITWNSTALDGGGIYCDESSPSLDNVTITGNTASRGSGIFCRSNSNPILENLTITGNSASTSNSFSNGGGIYCSSSSPILSNVKITGNSASSRGGGIFCYSSSPILENVTITWNSASNGGGIYCSSSNPSLTNVTITANSASNGGGIYCFSNSCPSFDNNKSCNLFLNYAGDVGNDLYANDCRIIDVIVDTFTVLQPNDYFVYPIDNFTFDIQNAKVEPLNHDLYVSPVGSNCNSGLTPDEPLLTISYALAKIIANNTNPHTIYISNGTYSPSLTGEIFSLNCRSYVSLQGENEDSTILDGEGLSGILTSNNDNNFSIENLTIRNGNANKGGGINCVNSSPDLDNVTITRNSASDDGGGIYCKESNPSLDNVTITANSASSDGGGIYCYSNSSPSLAYVTITGNYAYDKSGGGIYCGINSIPSFDSNKRCNLFLNYAGVGNDLYVSNCPVIDVIVDTFTVLQANDNFAYPIEKFTFNIQNAKVEPLNQDLYVNPSGSNDNSGLTPDEPLLTISYALTKIIADNTNPHTIYISNGTFSPSLTGEIFSLNCRSYVSLQGEDEDSTILDGEGLSGILTSYNDDNFSIESLTIQNGNASRGGGINCVSSSSPDLENLTITGNSATDGGGVCCSFQSNLSLENVTITGNSASDDGGGIFCTNISDPSLTNVIISGNSAYKGGGIYCFINSNPSLTNVTITENFASVGGGIYCYLDSNPSLLNCILWNDSPQEIYIESGSATATYSDIQGGWTGTGNIDADPLFAGPATGNFHLSWANFPIPDDTKSPCIDAGDPNSPFDPDGTIADMGAFYYNQSQVSQQINLSSGFSFVSSHIIPDNPDMFIVMADVLNDNLDFARNSLGQTLRKIGPNWVNGIGDWIVDEGYLVKMFSDDSFTINGALVDPATPIPVEAGFQFVSYFPENPMDALIAFETIIGDNLHFIRGSEGTMIRKIGPTWVNGIGDCQPGEGYLVKMFASDEIIYPSTAKSSGKVNETPVNLNFKGGNPAEAVYTLYIEGLEVGDEVAAYDGNKMVGAVSINSENAFENELPVFSSVINGKGYEEGNPVKIKVWSENDLEDTDFTMESVFDSYVSDVYPEGDGKYSVVNVTKGSIENTEVTIWVYPNPSKGIFNISLEGIKGDIQIKVIDIRGKEYYNFEINVSASTQLDLTELATGVYFISFRGKDFRQVKKIIIK